MQEQQCPADISTIPLEDLCIWRDQSMGWDDAPLMQDSDDAVDKEAAIKSLFRWEHVETTDRRRYGRGALSFQRVRLPLSEIHPCLHDIEFWTLDVRSTVLLVVVLVILVTFGAALFA